MYYNKLNFQIKKNTVTVTYEPSKPASYQKKKKKKKMQYNVILRNRKQMSKTPDYQDNHSKDHWSISEPL